MFYLPDQPHGLRSNPLNAIVVPRPIGWISTLDRDGRANLAPSRSSTPWPTGRRR